MAFGSIRFTSLLGLRCSLFLIRRIFVCWAALPAAAAAAFAFSHVSDNRPRETLDDLAVLAPGDKTD